ncbi:hypothetical protein THAOC_13231 [Thalassiosira oceanica]|uniref:DUF3291 domain-containing protein n=1 Tax=Thalassiosira oceanica TaxID=159749 RepID=K0RVS1_THAOC|nr:hypothetical protein THAOC_22921 [Thalassiosira oceanica]EJK65872.1 hypothetical protein THAOC_13231 [Thalassiosira oceanica]|mmetsp:Transcript_36344/g.86625  ORF Transcript_36344/g.86625 Transcript_36344/m.86625 type:complete len:136 (+) Transcript_36344:127-534(+)|eukprot:EJK57075.1 hypothetical protein THAOC_22921 [Thalassiosira oceanica]
MIEIDSYYTAVTALLPAHYWTTPKACCLSTETSKRASKNRHCISSKKIRKKGVFYTVSTWDSPEALEEFFQHELNDSHLRRMSKAGKYTKIMTFASTSTPPNSNEAVSKVNKEGIWIDVEHLRTMLTSITNDMKI